MSASASSGDMAEHHSTLEGIDTKTVNDRTRNELQLQLRNTFRVLSDGQTEIDAESLKKFYFMQKPYRSFDQQQAIDIFINSLQLNAEPLSADVFVEGVERLITKISERPDVKNEILSNALDIARCKTRSELISLFGLPVDISEEELNMLLNDNE